jgi:hypothetical protein
MNAFQSSWSTAFFVPTWRLLLWTALAALFLLSLPFAILGLLASVAVTAALKHIGALRATSRSAPPTGEGGTVIDAEYTVVEEPSVSASELKQARRTRVW